MRGTTIVRLTPSRAAVLVVGAVLLIVGSRVIHADRSGRGDRDAPTDTVDTWPGWRGPTADGRITHPIPTRWDSTNGVRWKVRIPGRGHSSPIVFGDRAYLTTAYETAEGVTQQDVLRTLTGALLVMIFALAAAFIAQPPDAVQASTARADATNIAITAIALLLAAFAIYGEPFLDLSRSGMRLWLGSTLFVSLCFAMSLLVAERALRLGLAGAVFAFTAFAIAAFPDADYAFRGGLTSLRLQILLAMASLPLIVGATPLAGLVLRRVTANRRVSIVATTVALAMISLGASLLIRRLLGFHEESFPETRYTPRLSRSLLAVVPLAFCWAVWVYTQRRHSVAARFGVALLGGAAIVVMLATTVELTAMHSSYLAYQLGSRPIEGEPGAGLAAGLGLALSLPLARSWARPGMRPMNRRIAALLVIAPLALGAAFFARVNGAQTGRHLVRAIVAVNRASGAIDWTLENLATPMPASDGRNSPATPTAVTDGRLICAYYGSPGAMCADRDGTLIWSRDDLSYEGMYGVAVSPVLAGRTLLIARDLPSGTAVVDALDAGTGATLWTRSFPTTPTFSGNNRTPIVRDIAGRPVLILWGMNYLKGLDVETGELAWSRGFDSAGDLVSSAIADSDRLYLSDASGTVAIDLDRLADASSEIRWRNGARANCVSPVIVNGMLFTITDSGVATATRAETGAVLWRQRLPGQYFASLVAAPDAIYATNSEGLTTVIAAEGTFRVIARNDLGEETMASMAAADGQLFIRSAEHLYAIGRD